VSQLPDNSSGCTQACTVVNEILKKVSGCILFACKAGTTSWPLLSDKIKGATRPPLKADQIKLAAPLARHQPT
jgi:hypothetical protein